MNDLALGIADRGNHEVDGHEPVAGHADVHVVPGGLALRRPLHGAGKLALNRRVVRPPVGLLEALAADVVEGEAGGLQRRAVGPHQDAVEVEDADEGKQVVEHVAQALLARPQGPLGRLAFGQVEDEGDALLAPRPDHAVADEDGQGGPVLAQVRLLVRRAPARLLRLGDGRLVHRQKLGRGHVQPADPAGLQIRSVVADHVEKGVVGVDDVAADGAADHSDRDRLDQGAVALLAFAIAGDLGVVGDGRGDLAAVVHRGGADQDRADDAVAANQLQFASDLGGAGERPAQRRFLRGQAAAAFVEVRPVRRHIGQAAAFQVGAEQPAGGLVDEDQALGRVDDDDRLRRLAQNLLEEKRRHRGVHGKTKRVSQRRSSVAPVRVIRRLLFFRHDAPRRAGAGEDVMETENDPDAFSA